MGLNFSRYYISVSKKSVKLTNCVITTFIYNILYITGVRLLQPEDKFKDQTFFLSQVKQHSLRRCMFPIANLLKSRVREIAKKEGLINVANKRDSTGICFIGKRRFQDFIEEVS